MSMGDALADYSIALNNREIATLFYASAICVSMLTFWKPSRYLIWNLIKAFLAPKLSLLWLTMSLYLAASIFLLSLADLWKTEDLKSTLLWWLSVGFATVFDANRLAKGSIRFRELARDTFAAAAIVLFVVELVSFRLWVEILLFPLIALLTALIAVGEQRLDEPGMERTVRFLRIIQAAAGFTIIICSLYVIFENVDQFWSIDTLREFGLPFLLWLLFVPYMLTVAALVAYEREFAYMGLRPTQASVSRSAKWQAILAFGWDIASVKRLTRDMRNRDISDRKGVSEAIKEIKRLKRLERNPPLVSPSEGWSPYKANGYLQEFGILTGDYHRTLHGWTAESSRVKLSDDVLADEVSYRLCGNDRAVTQIHLELRGYNRSDNTGSGTAFDELSLAALRKVVQHGEVSDIHKTALIAPSQALKVGAIAIEIKNHRWGDDKSGGYSKRLIVTHEMHKTD